MSFVPTLSRAGCALLLAVLAPAAAAHGDLHARIARLTASIREAPGSAPLYLQRGELHRIHKDWAAARRDFRAARELAPGRSDLDLHEGRLELSAGCHARARELLDRFLVKHPGHQRGLQSRARVLTKLGIRAAALRDYDTLLRFGGVPSPDQYLERARAQQSLEVGAAQIVAGLDQGVDRLGPIVVLHQAALDVELRGRAWPQALQRLDRMLAVMPLRAPWLLRRGMVLERMRRPGQARQAYAEGLAELAALPRRNKIQRGLEHSLSSRMRRLRAEPGQAGRQPR